VLRSLGGESKSGRRVLTKQHRVQSRCCILPHCPAERAGPSIAKNGAPSQYSQFEDFRKTKRNFKIHYHPPVNTLEISGKNQRIEIIFSAPTLRPDSNAVEMTYPERIIREQKRWLIIHPHDA
jgi:hypothetical protein